MYLASNYAAAQTDVEIIGDSTYPPYSFKESGRLTGIYTVILDRIFEKMPDYNVVLKGLPWKRGLKMVKEGEILALYPPYFRPKERPFMDYDLPILDEELVVFCSKEVLSKPRPKWPEDYYGLKIGNNSGFSAGGEQFWTAVKAGDIRVQEVKGTPANLLKLIAGRIDCYMNDGLSIQWELKKLAKEGRYDGSSVIKGTTISAEQGYLGFAVNAENFPYKQDFKEKYLSILKKMKASGEIQTIINDFVN